MAESEDALMTVADLARYLNVRDKWVYNRVASRSLPFVKVGHFVRFERHVIDEWLDRRAPRE